MCSNSEEVWMVVPGFEGLYMVSSLGNVLGVKRQKKLTPLDSHHGYKRVQLYKDGVLIKTAAVHRLVAEAFIPNPSKLPEVNHKDENPSNCCVDNLEWCDHTYNINYGHRLLKIRKRVAQILCGEVIAVFGSQKEAADSTGVRQGAISNVCAGRAKTAGGYEWTLV